MFFLLRCIFWLGLVFWHLDWSLGTTRADAGRSAAASPPRASVARAERSTPSGFAPLLQDLARQAGAKAQDWCASHPKDCIGALIGAAGSLDALEDAKPASTVASPVASPAPRPLPRGSNLGTRAG